MTAVLDEGSSPLLDEAAARVADETTTAGAAIPASGSTVPAFVTMNL